MMKIYCADDVGSGHTLICMLSCPLFALQESVRAAFSKHVLLDLCLEHASNISSFLNNPLAQVFSDWSSDILQTIFSAIIPVSFVMKHFVLSVWL